MEPTVTDIRTCWEKIRPGLEIIKRKCHADWRVEDVYSRCVSGSWTLFTAAGVDGFFICWKADATFRPEKVLEIECAYHAGDVDAFAVFEPLILELAKKNGCAAVQFRSPRKGYQRKGWKVVDMIYRQEVKYD